MLTIRSAVEADGPEVARVYVDSWNDGFGELMPTAALDERRITQWTKTVANGNWWIADVDGALAGFVGIGPSRDPLDPTLGELDTIAVDRPYWRQGIGTALMTKALQELANHYDEAILWTLANYPQGQNFYAKTGWTLMSQSRDGGNQVSYRRRFR